MAALTWSTLKTALQAIIARLPAPWTGTDAAFNELYPLATQYAENRIYRDIPMLAQRLEDTSLMTTAGQRNINLVGTALPIIVPERVGLVVPSGQAWQGGTLISATPVSLDFIDIFWPARATTWAPASALALYWANRGSVNSDFSSPSVVIAPTPDAVYNVVVTGLFQQTPMSPGTPQTYLSTVYPELLTIACMVYLSGALLRNYGSQADEKQMAISWENQYQELMPSARAEEFRRRGQGSDYLDRLKGDVPPTPAPQFVGGRR
jgi:hypothetical protein